MNIRDHEDWEGPRGTGRECEGPGWNVEDGEGTVRTWREYLGNTEGILRTVRGP